MDAKSDIMKATSDFEFGAIANAIRPIEIFAPRYTH
jgi:hypothetical protein